MRSWFSIYRLPVAIGAILLLIQWVFLSWNTTIGEVVPSIRFRTKNTVAGVIQEAAPTLSLHAILTGKYQQAVSHAIGALAPVFKPAIHWKNQLYYTLLGAAGSDRIVIGKHRELLELTYLDEYCARDLTKLRVVGDDWAGRIRKVQDFFEARGKPFLYVITPSKVAQYPQFIPDGYACPAPAEDKARKLEVFDAMLAQHGVHFVDVASNLPAAREDYGIDMFPRGGIHWTWLAAALGTQTFVAAINAQHRAPPLTEFTFDWKVSYNPSESDRDLLDIMNLPHPDRHYPVPELTYHSSDPPGGCRTVKITEVGGSFLMGINSTLERLACPPEITYWFYWDHERFLYTGNHMRELPIDPGVRRRSLLDADVVVFEENEAAGPATPHGKLMIQEIDAMAAGN